MSSLQRQQASVQREKARRRAELPVQRLPRSGRILDARGAQKEPEMAKEPQIKV